MKRKWIFIACLICLVQQVGFAQARRGMMPADVLRVAGVGDAQISPDGELVVYTVSTVDRDATRSSLWLVRASRQTLVAPRGTSAPLLSGDWSASNPRWSPDGKRIAFLASREGQAGIYVVSLAERQPRLVATIREANFFITYAGESFVWSPDSRRIAFISAGEDEGESGGTPLSASTRTEKPNDPRVIDRLQYKTRTSFSDRARTHVWVVDVDAPADRMQPRQLTSGPFYDHALTWNPQGNEIAFLSNHELDPEANNNSDIFTVDTQGRVNQLTNTPGCEYEPVWSPDGRWIAYTATVRDITTIDSVAEDTHVWVMDARGGAGRELSGGLDRRARSPRWSPDSTWILFLANNQGQTLVYQVIFNGGRESAYGPPYSMTPVPSLHNFAGPSPFDVRQPLVRLPPFQIGNFSVSARPNITEFLATARSAFDVQLAFTRSDATHPGEVWTEPVALYLRQAPLISHMQRLSTHNEEFTRFFSLAAPEEVNFKSFDGTTVQGWLMKPAGFREGQRYPLILSIHGGPHGMYGYGFNPTFQAYAARGYAVLYLNPRGSNGYGQKFSDGTLREWGGGDYRDLMSGVDEVLRTRAWIDPDKLGVTGGSYGGFMTNWIITQTPRFRAAVASASLSNLVSFYATSLYQDLIHAEFGGFPWDDFELLWRWSPLRYVKAVQTPTLFLHGEQDNDVHITQAEEMYMALKRRGLETVLVRYPREGHGLREPRHRLDALERTLAWFDKYLR